MEKERLLTGYTGYMNVLLFVSWTTIHLGRQLLPPLLPAIIEDLTITPSRAGGALTVMLGLYAVVHYPGGRLADELSRKTIMAFGLGVMAVGFGILLGVSGFPLFLVGVALVGIGAGSYSVSMRAFISDLFTRRRSQAFGINSAAPRIGGALAAGLAVVVLAVATWQMAFLPIVVLLSLFLLVLHWKSREPYEISPVDLGLRDTVRRMVRTPEIRWLIVAYTLYVFTWQAVLAFLPTYLQFDKGFTPALASQSFSIVFIVGIVVSPIAGYFGDRFPSLYVAASGILLALAGLLGLTVSPDVSLVTLSLIVFGGGMIVFPPVMQAHLMDIFPNSNMGGDFGAVKTVYSGLGSLGPVVVGLVAENVSYTLAYRGLALCLVSVVVTMVWLHRSDR